jgi:hypothetical protein
LWEAILDLLRDRGSVSRKEVLERFAKDDERHVAAVLNDLVTSRLVNSSGRGDKTIFSLTSEKERYRAIQKHNADSIAAMIWLAISRRPHTLKTLKEAFPIPEETVEAAVKALVDDGRIYLDYNAHPPVLITQSVVIPVGTQIGWEAAVFDHFRAVANAIASKVRGGTPHSSHGDVVGGTTLSFDLYAGHPYEAEVYGLLGRIRGEINGLWNKVATHNRQHPKPDKEKQKVVFYFGQNVEAMDADTRDDSRR